jgi:phospholipid transport system substrate-binding protein
MGQGLRILGFTMCLMLLIASAWGAQSPRENITRLNAVLLDVMKNADDLGFAGRSAKLRPVMSALYDFAFMARIAAGGYWKTLKSRDRDRLIDAFKRMSITTYAARFDGYSGERFEIVSDERSVRNTVLVKTRLIRPADSPVALNYLMRDRGGKDWRIVDVLLDARFSELARMRADYTSVLKRHGFAKLIATIEARIIAMGGT